MSDEDRLQSNINDLLPKIDNKVIEELNKIRTNGFNPKILIVPPNSLFPEGVNSFCGVFVEHRLLRKPDGEIIDILFEE